MKVKYKALLIIDGIVNAVLGVLLLLFPVGIIDLLGLPPTNTNFYPSILGAVLFGIGVALFLEAAGFAKGIRGLGLGGAIVINIIGSFVLICWLIFGSLVIPLKGRIILWTIGVVIFLIGIAEMVTKSWGYDEQ
ncbi:MAG: hypothetical protein Q7J01_07750 [Syntrophales bacterium]|nr:hypothetical protein [Syntrophales bacterium]